ncbi:Hypothetical protein R9X50_00491700 [Acrodontium crateriforme]|uniref:Uncharacterized protein n=1 Tax=Acrodontium crateriforme TaxID=150365 RepID=A0AAQ3M6Z3_9PEZI|nr:Hypothetical protein R9X50_00491700 [Acrodontium crateriforme]
MTWFNPHSDLVALSIVTRLTTQTSAWDFTPLPQTEATPINPNFPYAQDGHHPNATRSFPFQFPGQSDPWTLRINITESKAPGVTSIDYSNGIFQNRTTTSNPRILTSSFDFSWSGNGTLNETVVPMFANNATQPRFCLYVEGVEFSARVTNAYKGGSSNSSCDDAFGAVCAKAIVAEVDARAANQSQVLDGCPFDWFFNEIEECKDVFTGQGTAVASSRSSFEYLNNTSDGYNHSVTWPDRQSGDGFYYRFSDAYEAGNQTYFEAKTNRLNMVIVTAESTSLMCMRVNDTLQLKQGDPGTHSSAPGRKIQFSMWAVVGLAVAFFVCA